MFRERISTKKTFLTAMALAALTFAAPHSSHAQAPANEIVERYIDVALGANPDVQAERARWRQADARADQAYSNLYPKLDVSMQYMSYTGGRYISVAPNTPPVAVSKFGVVPWDNKLTAIWPIFNYAVWEGTRATKAYVNAASESLDAKQLGVAYSVAESYYNYAKASELVAIRDNAITLAKQNESTAEALFRAEKSQKNDVLRAQVAVASAEGDLLEAKNNQNLALTNFNNLLHRDYDARIDLPVASEHESSSNDLASMDTSTRLNALPSFSEDFNRAMQNRPELQQLSNTERATEGLRSVSASDYFPNLALFATYGFQEDKPRFDVSQDYLAAGVQLNWNLFEGFDTKSKVAENDAQIAEIEFQKESAISGIRLELQNARLETENAQERHDIAVKQLHAAEENRRITKAQYDAGTLPLITMIDAETTLANARANLTVTTYDELTAQAKYRKAVGMR